MHDYTKRVQKEIFDLEFDLRAMKEKIEKIEFSITENQEKYDKKTGADKKSPENKEKSATEVQ